MAAMRSALCDALLLSLICGSHAAGLVNNDVSRTVHLTSHIARTTVSIQVANKGATSAVEYKLAVPAAQNEKLSFLRVEDEAGVQLSYELGTGSSDYASYTVKLGKPLETGESMSLKVHMVCAHVMSPYPEAITQSEPQLVRYVDNSYYLSVYASVSMLTELKLASQLIESNTELSPTAIKGDTITYGPYTDVPAFSSYELMVHFENNRPFMTLTQMLKEIEVSHWGNIAVEETYQMQHDGAKLKGSFSRLDYQRNPQANGISSFRSISAVLPFVATNFYYRDDIGNISTSHVLPLERGVEVQLLPRFPMFGGWKTAFYIGYNLPLQYFLSTDAVDAHSYMLNITFGTPLVDSVVDAATVRVILPEGAMDIQLHTPFAVDSQSIELQYTYLDTSGRPVLSVSKSNMVDEHNQYFQVTYTFSAVSMLQEPMLLILAFFSFFVLCMVYVRLDFTISKDAVYAAQAKQERAAECITRVQDLSLQRLDCYDTMARSLDRMVKEKKDARYKEEKRGAEIKLNKLAVEMGKLNVELTELDGELAERLREMEREEKQKMGLLAQQHNLYRQYYISKALDKGTFQEAEPKYTHLFDKKSADVDKLMKELTE